MNSNTKQTIAILEIILMSEKINDVQEIVFSQCLKGKTYSEIAESLGYDVDYIKNVGSKLWKLVSTRLGEKVTKSNFRSVLRRIAQENQVESIFKSREQYGNGFRTEFLTVSGQKAVNYLDQFQELTEAERTIFESFDSFKNTQSTKYSLEERLNALPQLKTKIETLLVMVENAINNAQKAYDLE